jgi:translation elongation factor P/translation initiation factor 5A
MQKKTRHPQRARAKMKNIIKQGKFQKCTCEKCECEFTYQEDDTYYLMNPLSGVTISANKFVDCPCCGEKIELN